MLFRSAASTLEAEYISLSQGMRELIPLRQLVEELLVILGLSESVECSTRSTVFEDNQGALILAKSSSKLTPRTKHIAVKYHFFREYVSTGKIKLQYVESEKQEADILTKGLGKEKFSMIRKLILGW